MRFRWFLGFGLSLACGVLAGVPAVRALPLWQEPAPQAATFRADVDLVLLPVAVLDPDGRPVTDLSVEEFHVYEDGEPQQITHFLAPDATPLDVALVLDSSASLAPWGRLVRSSANTFLRSLEARDCVVLLPFSQQVSTGYWALASDPTLSRRIDGLFMGGGTALYDAVHQALATVDAASTGEAQRCGEDLPAKLDGSPQRRRAIVLLSDGADKNSQHRFDEVLALAQRTSIPLFPVLLGEARRDAQLRATMEALAGNTGGEIIEADSPAALRQAYDDVVALLRASYLLGYLPRDGARTRSRHEISVRSRRASYRLVHRSWYLR